MTTYYQANNNTETVPLVNTSISKVIDNNNEAALSAPTAAVAVASWKKKMAVVISAAATVVGTAGLVGMSTDGKQLVVGESFFRASLLRKEADQCCEDDDWDSLPHPGCPGICPEDDGWDPTTDDIYGCRELNRCPTLFTFCTNQDCTSDSDCPPPPEDDFYKGTTMSCLAGQCYKELYPQCAEIAVGHRQHLGKYQIQCD